jgi:uncharacterized protein (DUF3084 family)
MQNINGVPTIQDRLDRVSNREARALGTADDVDVEAAQLRIDEYAAQVRKDLDVRKVELDAREVDVANRERIVGESEQQLQQIAMKLQEHDDLLSAREEALAEREHPEADDGINLDALDTHPTAAGDVTEHDGQDDDGPEYKKDGD